MGTGSTPAEILGFGAIGLGFLLAVLAYFLLRKDRPTYTPIYVFLVFNFGLVLVGAWLQYIGNTSTAECRAELQKTKSELAAVQASLASAHNAMTQIAGTIPQSIKDLQAVNSILTGLSCSGGMQGEPLWGGYGTKGSQLGTNVMNRLSGAERLIESIVPKK